MKTKVSLRQYRNSDLQFLHELLSDEQTKRYFPYMYTKYLEQSQLRLKTRLSDQEWGVGDRYVIQDFFSRQPIGEISGATSAEDKTKMNLSIIIHPKYRGKGYAKQGILIFVSKIMKEQPEIKTFVMEIAKENDSSKAVAEKLEFKLNSNGNFEKNNTEFWEKSKDEF